VFHLKKNPHLTDFAQRNRKRTGSGHKSGKVGDISGLLLFKVTKVVLDLLISSRITFGSAVRYLFSEKISFSAKIESMICFLPIGEAVA
jgi:hypothetical protein